MNCKPKCKYYKQTVYVAGEPFKCSDLGLCSIANLGDRSHTLLSDIGTITHDQIEASIIPETWRNVGDVGEPAFQDSWVNLGGGFEAAQFRKVGDVVEIRGVVAGGDNNTTIFVLPTGYRPANTLIFNNWASGPSGYGRVDVRADGAVRLISSSAASPVTLGIDVRFSTL